MNAKPLPMFPAPYPDESLYSVFCRYHQRSGNASWQDTMIQLFHSARSLRSSVLTPFCLSHSQHWYHPDTGITAEYLLMHHTVFQYSCIITWDFRRSEYLKTITNTIPVANAFRMRHGISSKKNLCYCPECVSEDISLFGETYWHLLPQLDGIEYCPRHKCRIQESPVNTVRLSYHFFPASEYTLFTKNKTASLSPARKEEFMMLAQNIEWVHRHGALLKYETVCEDLINEVSIYNNTPKKIRSIYHTSIVHYYEDLMHQNLSSDFLSEINELYEFNTMSVFSTSAIRIILLIALQFGSVDNYYIQKLKKKI